jgi:hypothetical protein
MLCQSWFKFYGDFFASHSVDAQENGPYDHLLANQTMEREEYIPQPPFAISSSNLYFPAKAVKSMLVVRKTKRTEEINNSARVLVSNPLPASMQIVLMPGRPKLAV